MAITSRHAVEPTTEMIPNKRRFINSQTQNIETSGKGGKTGTIPITAFISPFRVMRGSDLALWFDKREGERLLYLLQDGEYVAHLGFEAELAVFLEAEDVESFWYNEESLWAVFTGHRGTICVELVDDTAIRWLREVGLMMMGGDKRSPRCFGREEWFADRCSEAQRQFNWNLTQARGPAVSASAPIDKKPSTKRARDEGGNVAGSRGQFRDTGKSNNFKKRRFSQTPCCISAGDIPSDRFPEKPHPGDCTQCLEICFECWQQALAVQAESQPWDQVKCCSCQYYMQEPEIRALATREVYEAWLLKSTHAFLSVGGNGESDEVHIVCPMAKCKGAGFLAAGSTWFDCDQCKATYCTSCDVVMHRGESCEDYLRRKAKEDQTTQKRQAAEEAASMARIERKTKSCPNPKCSVLKLEKRGGCDHFTCDVCNFEFCWKCLAPYKGAKGINKVGNDAHARTCQYHSDTLPEYDGGDSDEDSFGSEESDEE
ncbi:hypothetical protein MBLNU230_g2991t1 [Neophaeotheca triangularis]